MHNINLLPPSVIRQFEHKRVIKAWSRLLTVAIIVALLSIAWGQTNARKMRQQTQQQLALASYPQEIRQQHAKLSSRLRALTQYENSQAEQRSRFSPLVVMSMLHQLKQDLGGQLQARSIEFAEHTPTTPASTGNTPTSSKPNQIAHGFVTLQLVANDTSACSDLMHRLKQSQLFASVKLSSPLESIEAQSDALRFTVRCEF